MQLVQTEEGFDLYKEKTRVGRCAVRPAAGPARGADIGLVWVDPAWRRRGYGTYLLRQLLHRFGGYDREAESLFTAPLPADEGERAFWAAFGFAPEGDALIRRRRPDLTAVRFAQDFLAQHLARPRLLIDATCGNGGDTAFLCRLAGAEGRVLAFDIQQKALDATRARLAREGLDDGRCRLILDSHEPDHAVHSDAASSIPALAAALDALRPGGVLSAVLYSGAVIGDREKQAALHWMEALPIARYTVLTCRFANWADTAPLPCLVLKK